MYMYVCVYIYTHTGFPCGSNGKESVMQKTQFLSLGQEDLLEKRMATYSSILSWRSPKDREAWWATVQGIAKTQTQLSDYHFSSNIYIYIYIYRHTHIYSKNFEVHYRKTLIFLEETPGRNMYVKADSSENLERSEKIYRENFYHLRKYIYHYE